MNWKDEILATHEGNTGFFKQIETLKIDKMKTFKDLEFKPHTIAKGGVHAQMDFDNGTYISVVGGATGLYGNGSTSFEVMSTVTENTSRGVEGGLSKKQVSDHMRYLQSN